MSEVEKLTTLIGELVCTEIDSVKHVYYSKRKAKKLTAFDIIMKNGNRYIAQIKEV